MPGAIHVSVLDFKDLPSSSILVKAKWVPWGKENIKHGTRANCLCNDFVQTLLVPEKGSWDDFIPLEGGGQVHMNMQFVLSEEERNRIRSTRESAMKKKYDEHSQAIGQVAGN
ncbi:uncharacterized protein LOC127795541 isoform X4 [Diospyros lotus]|uniref:uncharacterized protein LOC127795541 isoform X4 n=1 Tax=Diospyros lotus TaxID=55363 RepID=UPI002255EF01|nr:uncharacterized protein LOC127795541 isoform X4 [Diospyros lotus]